MTGAHVCRQYLSRHTPAFVEEFEKAVKEP
jgi:hypothetical protein